MAKDGDLDGPELLEVAAERLEVCGPVSAPRFKELVGIDEVGAPARANAGTIGPLDSEGHGVREGAVVGAARVKTGFFYRLVFFRQMIPTGICSAIMRHLFSLQDKEKHGAL